MAATWTHRQVLVALAWLSEARNRPSRADHYAMQVSQEIKRIPIRFLGGNLDDVKLEDQKIEWKPAAPPKKMSKEEQIAMDKAILQVQLIRARNRQRGNKRRR